ncbi:LysR family transcriptional regulator [Acidihalobacter ferrooxydans]|uniref:HTH lysR-type domain-containing protein n=1 Tax=Acidihalobacter ferrooxydans TaxID=1765967 RepID=A0A1P8UEJ6_9GAMM|nr:LysR family transcriptional regulator [Acidihalobacter ferrooxydans]APZ42250.1 hypothetical protein BW247_03380 [Acidihalobacter ferrooxydans]
MRLNPDQLLTFATVVREGGVSSAAQRLHLSQPAVSNQLRKLQDSLGEPLYRRAGRGIALTGVGQRLYAQAQRVADALAAAQALADSLATVETGQIRIAASQTPGAYLLPAVIAGFRQRAPGIDIELASYNSHEVTQRMADCDLAFVEGPRVPALPAGWHAQTLDEDEIVALVRRDHVLAGSRSVTLQRLSAEPLILRERGSSLREQVEQAFRDAGLTPRVDMRLAGVAAVKEAVRQGLGVGFASRLAVRHDRGPLLGIALDPPLRRQLTLLVPGNPSAASTRLLTYLRERR